MRGVTPEQSHATMADGRVFTGSQALDAGLVDKIGTYEDAIAKAAELGAIFKKSKPIRKSVAKAELLSNNQAQLNKGTDMTKATLPPEDATAEAAALETQAVEAGVSLEAAAQAAALEEGKVVAFLKAELKDAQVSLHAAQAESTAAKKVADDMQTTYAKFEAIARQSVDAMAIPLGGSGATALAGEVLLAEHERLVPLYTSKFKAEGVAATALAASTSAPAKGLSNPMLAARVQLSKAK
jgi:ClpP class serine protease